MFSKRYREPKNIEMEGSLVHLFIQIFEYLPCFRSYQVFTFKDEFGMILINMKLMV